MEERKTKPIENVQNIKAILTLKLDYQKFKARMNERLNDDMNGNGLTTFLIASLIYYIGTQIMGQFHKIISGIQILLTSLAPSRHTEFSI